MELLEFIVDGKFYMIDSNYLSKDILGDIDLDTGKKIIGKGKRKRYTTKFI